MNRTRTMALAGALMLGGSLGAGTPAVRAQTYADPPWASGGAPAYTTYPAGGTYSTYPSPDYAAAAPTTTAPPPAPVDNPARIGTLEDRIRALESQLRGTGGSSGAVIDFIEERGW